MAVYVGFLKSNSEHREGRDGFTLFEAVISIALLLLVISSFGGFVISMMSTSTKVQSAQEVQGNARMALDAIAVRIRGASDINDASSVWDVDPGVLSLAMADPIKNPTLISLDHDDGTLVIQEGGAPPIALTSSAVNIQALQFTRYTHDGGKGVIGVQLTLSTRSQSDAYGTYTDTISTAVSVRR